MSSISASLTANFSTQLLADDISNLYIQQKEVDMINHFAAEYLKKIAGQFVYYIKVDRDNTQAGIYGESKSKIIQHDPVKLPATIQQIVKPENDSSGIRYSRTLRVGFLTSLNKQYGINDIVMGDYIQWNSMIYEIIQPPERQRMIFGQERFSNFEIVCTCKVRQ